MRNRNKNRNRTKKNRRYRKNKTFKVGGDVSGVTNSNVGVGVDDLTKKIESSHSLSNFLPDLNLGDSKVMNKIVELSEALAIKSIDNAALFFDIDLNNSEKFNQRLQELKDLLNDPKNKDLMREMIVKFSEVGIVALDAARPFIDELISEIFEKLKVVGNEFGEAGVKIALNTLEEIPGYGVIIGTIRSVSTAMETGLSVSNTFSEVVTKTSDTINASVQNFDKLLKEKGDLENRISNSVNGHIDNMKSIPNSIIKGGGDYSRKHKRNNNKTKKVRFIL